jgi:hypothetical protein
LSERQLKREVDNLKRQLLHNSVRDALIANGADPAMTTVALNHLTASGIIKLNDNDEPVFTVEGKWGPEDFPAAEGAKRYLATEEGTCFLPPSRQQATSPQRGGPPQGGPAPRNQSGELDWNALADGMKHRRG